MPPNEKKKTCKYQIAIKLKSIQSNKKQYSMIQNIDKFAEVSEKTIKQNKIELD